ncbi:MAG: adenine phosphoribosyltransferase [Rhodobacteraceae bacterium]|nr:adenine phosphoribosyltransferase [Paracoccaceae bacterium]
MTKTVADYIRTIPDFPHEGIMFRDVTTLFGDAEGFKLAIDLLVEAFRGTRIDKVAGLEARGFILGGAVAHHLDVGFVAVRKKGKLPGNTIAEDYDLEYGTATMEIHEDAIEPGERVLIVDDLVATGGTAAASIRLIERLGGEVVHAAFVIDLPDLGGARVIENLGVPILSLCAFEGA